jgi:anti-sigma factor RsiW
MRPPLFHKNTDMIRDDDSFLSAYMDGQLDSEQRQNVESALVSNPQLAEALRRLTTVRDLVAGLPRDSSVNVLPQVMERIRSRTRSRAWFLGFSAPPAGSRPFLVAGGMFASAALLVFAITLALSFAPLTHPHLSASRPATAAASAKSPTTTPIETAATSAAGESGPSSFHSEISQAIAASTPKAGDPPLVLSSALPHVAPAPRDLEQVRQLLDSPSLRRVFFVRNGKGGKSEQRVASVIERTTRYGFFKLTIAQGIVIDPRHPEEATVFALVVDPMEADSLRDQIRVALEEPIEETAVDPGIVTQLVDIGQVQGFPPSPLADVLIPREDLALRTPVSGAEHTESPASPAGPAARDRKTAGKPSPAPAGPQSPLTTSDPRAKPAGVIDPALGAQVAQRSDAAAPIPGRPSDPIDGSGVMRKSAPVQANSPPHQQTDDKIVVLVWVYKPRSS